MIVLPEDARSCGLTRSVYVALTRGGSPLVPPQAPGVYKELGEGALLRGYSRSMSRP